MSIEHNVYFDARFIEAANRYCKRRQKLILRFSKQIEELWNAENQKRIIFQILDNHFQIRNVIYQHYPYAEFDSGDDGSSIVKIPDDNPEKALSFILSLGSKVKVLGPETFVEQVKEEIQKINVEFEGSN